MSSDKNSHPDVKKTAHTNHEQGDHICPVSVAKWLNSPIRTILENPKRLLKPLINPGDTVVDLGCGGGVFSVAAAKLSGTSGKVYAVDVQPEMLELTESVAKKKKVSDRVKTHLANAVSLDLEENLADLVLAIHMVHETPDPNATLEQIAKILKPGGKLLVLEPKMHVDEELFKETTDALDANNMELVENRNSIMGRGGVYRKKA